MTHRLLRRLLQAVGLRSGRAMVMEAKFALHGILACGIGGWQEVMSRLGRPCWRIFCREG
jgi:hypothetical protein